MEIVKRGVPRAERPWLGTCCNCGSVLRAKAAELEMLHWVKQEKEQGKGKEAERPKGGNSSGEARARRLAAVFDGGKDGGGSAGGAGA